MRIASEQPQPLIILSVCIRVLLSLLHSRCYDAQHLKSRLLAAPLLRHLHGHCVVYYTVQGWLVFIMIIPVDEREATINTALSRTLLTAKVVYCYYTAWKATLSNLEWSLFLLGIHIHINSLVCVWNTEASSETMPRGIKLYNLIAHTCEEALRLCSFGSYVN